jgi:phosphocarrier protein HPr
MSDTAQDSVVIAHEVGLHARPSVSMTKLAKTFSNPVEIAATAEGPWIDAKSIVKVMAMKARQHSTLHIRASGAEASKAVAAIKQLVLNDFAGA